MMAAAAGSWLAWLAARWKRAAAALLALWLLLAYAVISPLRCQEPSPTPQHYQDRLRAVTDQLAALQAQHSAIVSQIKSSRLSASFPALAGSLWDDGPSEAYETVRRRVYEHTKDLWYYVSHELSRAIVEPDRATILQNLVENVEHRKSVLLADQERLADVDGHAAWREREAANVSVLVQRRLRSIQHPPDCKRARKVVCNLNKGCGFGCQLHHIAYCLIFAYATERTLVLNSRGWRYDAKGWDRVFLPLSDTCTVYDTDRVAQWPDLDEAWKRRKKGREKYEDEPSDEGDQRPETDLLQLLNDAQTVSLPFIDSISQKPKFLPLAIPKDLAHRIVRFNGDPASWWVGQMLAYILRPRDHIQKTINESIARLNYRNPIVGVHIRRTDKVGTEAAYHHIHEYMKHVQQYWLLQEARRDAGDPPVVRQVYLASDDPTVLEDARKKYPGVTFIGDPLIARTAATQRRYTPASLAGLLVDLTLLARADYLVCTFSSQVGRVAYELMQGNRPDASGSVASLDDIYYFGGQNAHDRRATMDHEAAHSNEISFKAGDLIGIAGNHWNGYGRGTNRRTNMNGLIPWYKTTDHLVLYPFPEYRELSDPQ